MRNLQQPLGVGLRLNQQGAPETAAHSSHTCAQGSRKHTHTHIHTHTHSHIHTQCTHIQTQYIHIHTLPYTKYTHNTHTYNSIYIRTYMLTHTYLHTHSYRLTLTHSYIHSRTHTHTRQSPTLSHALEGSQLLDSRHERQEDLEVPDLEPGPSPAPSPCPPALLRHLQPCTSQAPGPGKPYSLVMRVQTVQT